MTWLPDDFFIGYPEAPEARPSRPIGQGDVFADVPVAGRTGISDQRPGVKVKVEKAVIVVASSCGMRKTAGGLNDIIHVAPVSRLESLAPGWSAPWEGWLQVLPLPGLALAEEGGYLGANLGRIGLSGTDTLDAEKRLACASVQGMRALKARLSTYFSRVPIPHSLFAVGAHEEWNELDLWERWVARIGSEAGFQEWLERPNPNYPGQRRRDTIYADLVGLQGQLDEATAS